MTARPTDATNSLGRAERLAAEHRFKADTTRLQAGDALGAILRGRVYLVSLMSHAIAVAIFVLLSGWIGQSIGQAIVAPLSSFGQAFELFAALLISFMGIYGFMRLAQAAVRALFDADESDDWPRKGVDWGRQTVVVDSNGISLAMSQVRRRFWWNTMAQLSEDDVFVIDRKDGAQIVIPKDPADENELRQLLFKGITRSEPVRKRR